MYKCWCYVQVGVERKIEFRWVPSISGGGGFFRVGLEYIFMIFARSQGSIDVFFFCELNDSK